MNDRLENKNEEAETDEALIENRDFYFDDGLMVLTGRFLKKRGHCCKSGCRHCPYDADSKTRSE